MRFFKGLFVLITLGFFISLAQTDDPPNDLSLKLAQEGVHHMAAYPIIELNDQNLFGQ